MQEQCECYEDAVGDNRVIQFHIHVGTELQDKFCAPILLETCLATQEKEVLEMRRDIHLSNFDLISPLISDIRSCLETQLYKEYLIT